MPGSTSSTIDRNITLKHPTLTVTSLAAASLLIVLAGCGGASQPSTARSSAATFSVAGTLRLIGPTEAGMGEGCYGTNGYDDLEAGAQITIADATGKTVGLGELDKGHRMTTAGVCAWDFTVDGIPDTEGPNGIYSIEISHRGSISFKRSEASDVELTIGS